MQTRKLGWTDLELTTVGLGCWAMGGPWKYGWGEQDDNDSIATLHRAVELGINWLDTAPVYGLGRSEEVIGRTLKELPKGLIVATKCGRFVQGHPAICVRRHGRRAPICLDCSRLQIRAAGAAPEAP